MSEQDEIVRMMAGRIRTSDVFQRVDGRWLRRHHHEGTIPTDVPPITEPPPQRG